MLEFVIQPLQIFLNGVLGKDRQANRQLRKKLKVARAECDRIAQDRNRLGHRYKAVVVDLDRLDHRYKAIAVKRDRLKLDCDLLLDQHNQLKTEHVRLQRSHRQTEADYAQLQRSHSQLKSDHTQSQQSQRQLTKLNTNLLRKQQSFEAQLEAAYKENQDTASATESLLSTIKALKKDNTDLIEIADQEIERLELLAEDEKEENRQLLREKTALEVKLSSCLYRNSQEEGADSLEADSATLLFDEPASESFDHLDLSKVSIAIVGGHSNLRNNVVDKLIKDHGIHKKRIREVSDDHSSGHGIVKNKIQSFDFIFIITTSISHKLNNSVMDLNKKHSLDGQVIRLDSKGVPSVVFAILKHVAHRIDT